MKLKHLVKLAATTALGVTLATAAQAGPDDDSLIIAWGSTGPIEHPLCLTMLRDASVTST